MEALLTQPQRDRLCAGKSVEVAIPSTCDEKMYELLTILPPEHG